MVRFYTAVYVSWFKSRSEGKSIISQIGVAARRFDLVQHIA